MKLSHIFSTSFDHICETQYEVTTESAPYQRWLTSSNDSGRGRLHRLLGEVYVCTG